MEDHPESDFEEKSPLPNAPKPVSSERKMRGEPARPSSRMEVTVMFPGAASKRHAPAQKTVHEEQPIAPVPPLVKEKITDQELRELIELVFKIREEFEAKLDIFKQRGAMPENVQKYLDNPQNFSLAKWEVVQQLRKAKYRELSVMLGKDVPAQMKAQEGTKKAKERKAKTLGWRKGWTSLQ